MACKETTASTKYLVRGSGPQSLVICKRSVSRSSSQESQKDIYLWMCFNDCLSPGPMRLFGIRPKELVAIITCCCLLRKIKP